MLSFRRNFNSALLNNSKHFKKRLKYQFWVSGRSFWYGRSDANAYKSIGHDPMLHQRYINLFAGFASWLHYQRHLAKIFCPNLHFLFLKNIYILLCKRNYKFLVSNFLFWSLMTSCPLALGNIFFIFIFVLKLH